jgi:hypothetical protein
MTTGARIGLNLTPRDTTPTPEPDRASCWRCEFRRPIVGEVADVVSCSHPEALLVANGVEANLQSITGGRGPIGVAALGIRGEPLAIQQGRFNWPISFEVSALIACRACPPVPRKQTADPMPERGTVPVLDRPEGSRRVRRY